MKSETITCDICGAIKKQTNHWFNLYINKDLASYAVTPFTSEHFVILPAWKRNDICGVVCLHKAEAKVRDGK